MQMKFGNILGMTKDGDGTIGHWSWWYMTYEIVSYLISLDDL